MKKAELRALLKLRELSNKVIGEEETEKIINETVKEAQEEIKNIEKVLKNEKTGLNEEKKPRFSLKKGKKGDK